MKPETTTEFRQALRRLEAEIGINLSGETECCGVTTAQCHLILEIDRCSKTSNTNPAPDADRTSLGVLAENLSTDKGALSRTLDSLVRDGIACRVENPENRRKISISLTPKGAEKANHINALCNASYERVFALIPEEKHGQIIESVAILAEAMRVARKEEGEKTCCNRT